MRMTRRAQECITIVAVGMAVIAIVLTFSIFSDKALREVGRTDQFRARCDSVYGKTYISDKEMICYLDGKITFSEK